MKSIRYRQSSIIEIEQFVNDTNVTVVNEDEQFEVLLRPLAMGIVAEAINSTAAKAADAKKAIGPVGDSDADEISQSLKFSMLEIRVRDVRHQSASLA